MRLRQPHLVLSIAALGVVAFVTLPGVVGLLGEVYRVDGGAASAAAVHTATPARVAGAEVQAAIATQTLKATGTATASIEPSSTPLVFSTYVTATPVRTASLAQATPAPVGTALIPAAASTTVPAPSSTPRAGPTLVPSSTAGPTSTASPTRTPVPTSTSDPCLSYDAALVFASSEHRLSAGAGTAKLLLENKGGSTARELRLSVTALEGGERVRSFALGEQKWDLALEKQLLLSLRELAPGSTTSLELSYDVDFSSRANSAVTKAVTSRVMLLVEVVGEHCRSVSASMRVIIEPEIKTLTPISTVPAAVEPKSREAVSDNATAVELPATSDTKR